MIVAIDGPAGSGKSTVAHEISRRRGLTYLDTGAMYRSVTLACLERGVDLTDNEAVADVARSISISFTQEGDAQHVLVDGLDVSEEIRTARVDQNVSVVSAVPEVRTAMVALQRAVGEGADVVAEGRDIGTAVYPNADVKVFLTADASARAHRRAVQREGGDADKVDKAVDADEERRILADLKRRDQIDSTRATSPLVPAEDAVHIDSSNLTVDEVCRRIEELIEAKAPAQPAEKPAQPIAEKNGEPGAKSERPARGGDAEKAEGGAEGASFRPIGNRPEVYWDSRMRQFPLLSRGFLGVAVAVVNAYTRLMWRWEIEGFDKALAATSERGAVIVMNHVSMLDPLPPYCKMYFSGRRIRAIYKDEFNKVGIMRAILSVVGGIPVKRGTADIKALRRAQRALQAGESVLIYPEGTRIKSNDEPVTLHGGFALMAKMGHAEVLPMAIVGARDITPRGHKVPRPGKVWLKVGDPISFDQIPEKGRKAQVAAMEKLAMERVYQLRDELRAEHPGKM